MFAQGPEQHRATTALEAFIPDVLIIVVVILGNFILQ
jgi:hypothetical protein